jgi:hypothetical protein
MMKLRIPIRAFACNADHNANHETTTDENAKKAMIQSKVSLWLTGNNVVLTFRESNFAPVGQVSNLPFLENTARWKPVPRKITAL